jgi:hypothetical protein
MNEADLIKAINDIPIETIWWLAVKFAITFLFLGLLKVFLESVIDYMLIRGHKYMSVGTIISMDGFVGRIKSIGIWRITIESTEGYYSIPTKGWQTHKLIFLRTVCLNGHDQEKITK